MKYSFDEAMDEACRTGVIPDHSYPRIGDSKRLLRSFFSPELAELLEREAKGVFGQWNGWKDAVETIIQRGK